MQLTDIKSRRSFQNEKFWQIVYKWEDIFSKELEIPIVYPSKNKFLLTEIFPSHRRKSLVFDMLPYERMKRPFLKANQDHIPYIIDFWLTENQINDFTNAYKNAFIVLISSREVYEYLIRKKVPLKLHHLALSIPDDDAIVNQKSFYEKKYDLVLAGRISDLWNKWISKYSEDHPNFKLVTRKIINDSFLFEYQGEVICIADNRKDYLNLLSDSKVFLYSTPGIDGEKDTNGFHPVTPRFMEGLTGGCNMILRYEKNPDTDYYEFNLFNESVESYEMFCQQMDKALTQAPDLDFYSSYLLKHTTSQRAKELKEILKKY